MRLAFLLRAFSGSLLLAPFASLAAAQSKPPVISTRQFAGGSAKVTVTGSFGFSADIAINKMASFGDGEATWLQFGNSGSADPNATITYGTTGETGITVAQGKLVATGGIIVGEPSECSGKVEVTTKLVSGRYTCTGVTSHDPATGKMGKVNIEVVFTASS